MILLTSSSPITQITNKVIPDMYTASVLLVLIGLILPIQLMIRQLILFIKQAIKLLKLCH